MSPVARAISIDLTKASPFGTNDFAPRCLNVCIHPELVENVGDDSNVVLGFLEVLLPLLLQVFVLRTTNGCLVDPDPASSVSRDW